jgi:hypothetical protein
MKKTKTIDSIEFTAAPFPAIEALRLKAYLIKTFGPALAEALGTFTKGVPTTASIGDVPIDGRILAEAVEKLMSTLDEQGFVTLVKRLFIFVTAKGKTAEGKHFVCQFDGANFDASLELAFAGRLFSIYPVIGLVLEANYPDFFDKTVRSIGSRISKIGFTASGSTSEIDASENSAISEN